MRAKPDAILMVTDRATKERLLLERWDNWDYWDDYIKDVDISWSGQECVVEIVEGTEMGTSRFTWRYRVSRSPLRAEQWASSKRVPVY